MELNRSLARLALAAGIVAIAADLSYGMFVAAGEPYGSVNDVGNATFAILAGWFAWGMRGRTGLAVASLALVGAAVGVVGSWLVLSGTTGWLLAGFVSAVGFALIGPSVILMGRSMISSRPTSRRIGRLGVLTGILMLVGLVALAAVANRFDDEATLPGWAWIGFAGWIGAFVLFPAWAIWIGRVSGRALATTSV